MAILVDFSQTVIAAVVKITSSRSGIKDPNIDIIRHCVLESLRYTRSKYKKEYGELVICVDGGRSWRKDVFPYYKAHRQVDKDKSMIPWDLVFEAIGVLKQELTEHFPYKVVEVKTAEADDVIAVLTKELTETGDKVMIVSSDKDFRQLQVYPGVKQYSPLLDKYLVENDPLGYLRSHIISGDRGDGIPNILSVDDTFVMKKRQKPLLEKKLNQWVMCDSPEDFCNSEMLRNYHRNAQLIDLVHGVPETLKAKILEQYEIAHAAPRAGLLNYFIDKKLKNLMEKLQEF